MAREREFENGAVIRNEAGEYLCTENGKDLFWSNSTEHAFCFFENKAAEKFLNDWNDKARMNNRPDLFIHGVKIESSNCGCGEIRRPVGVTASRRPSCACGKANDDVEVCDEMIITALNILNASELDDLAALADKKEELEGEKAELESALNQVKEELTEVNRKVQTAKTRIERKLDTVFVPKVKQAIIKHLLS